jgi:16S rRNA (cytidine1402-2'-O)-methyltransferase
LVFFEAPHRISETIEALRRACGGDRPGAICREMTKTYEEVVRGTLDELHEWTLSKEMLGEFTVVISGYDAKSRDVSSDEIAAMVKRFESTGITRKEAITMTAKELRIPKRKVFDIMVVEK